jgi:hypothetical protein
MQHRKLSIALAGVMLAAASFTASADVLFQNLGTAAPPATLGSHVITPFDQAAQAAIPNFTMVSVIPGSPVAGDLTISPEASKRTVPSGGWNSSWSHGYTGPVFFAQATSATLTLPPNTRAFYFYAQGNFFSSHTFTVTTDGGATSGPVSVSTAPAGGADGATGFAFYSTAGETITSISISAPTSGGMSFGEFGIGTGPVTTCASEGYTGTKLEWCKNICERGYTGGTLAMWIRRWTDRYRTLPYCALEPQPVPTAR